MVSSSNDCDASIVAALGREASAREIAAVKRRAASLVGKLKGGEVDPGVFLNKFLDQEEAARLARKRDEYNNYAAGRRLDNWRTSTPELDNAPRQGLLAQLVGSLLDFKGSKDSVASRMDKASYARMGAFWNDLESGGYAQLARGGELDDHIGGAIWDIQHGVDAGKVQEQYGKAAADMANIFIKHKSALVANYNEAGGHIQPSDEHIVTRMYDSAKVAKAGGAQFGSPEALKAFLNAAKKMDWSKSFDGEYTGASQAERDKIMSELWSDFIAGRHPRFEKGNAGIGMGRQNVAARFAKGREIAFSSAADEMAWLKQFNRGDTLADSLTYNLSRSAADAELMRRFGANPIDTFDRFFDRWDKELRADPAKTAERQKFVNQKAYIDKNIWPALLRDSALGTDNPVAKFLALMRGSTFMAAKVGSSLFSNLGDLAAHASADRYYWERTTGGYWKSAAKSLNPLLHSGLTEDERKQVAVEMGFRFQHVGRPMGPVAEDAYGLGSVARLSQIASKYFSHSWWENTTHTTNAMGDAYRFGTLSGKAFEELRPEVQGALGQFGITKPEWEIMRSAEHTTIGKYTALIPSDIRALDLEKFKALSPEAKEPELTRLRGELADKYRNLLGEKATLSSAYPTRAMKALTTYGTQAGTVQGELMRGAMMLKTFTLNYMRNSLGRELYGYGQGDIPVFRAFVNSLRDSGARGGLVNLMVGSLAAGYARDALWDVAAGKTPQDPMTGAAFERAAAFQTLGLLTDFAFADAKMGGAGQPENTAERVFDLMGPVFGNLGQAGDIAIDAVNEMGKPGGLTAQRSGKLERRLFSLLYHNVPGNNAFWAKAALNYMVFNNLSERLDPGYQARLQKYTRQNGQSYFIPPGPQSNR